jgi:hypothetical protein
MDFTTIYDCIVDLSEERKQKLFKNLGEGPYRVEFYNSADFNDDSYKKMAQWTMYNNDCNFKDGPYNLDDYTDKGALIVPDDGWGFLTVYNSKGSTMIYIHYSKGKLKSLELIRKSKTLYKAEGRFETEYADGSPFYIFVTGNSVVCFIWGNHSPCNLHNGYAEKSASELVKLFCP